MANHFLVSLHTEKNEIVIDSFPGKAEAKKFAITLGPDYIPLGIYSEHRAIAIKDAYETLDKFLEGKRS